MKTRVAVIGVGNMGKHHARVYSELDNAELVAVSDIDEQLGIETSKKYGCKYYQDYLEMIEKESIDAVSIAVPSSLHKQISVNVLKQKKHVLLEKPIALTLEESLDIIRTAKKNNVKLMIGHIERFNPVIRRIKRLINSKELGEPMIISTQRIGTYPKQITDVNVVLDLAIHDIDIMSHLFEEQPKKIFSIGISKNNVENAAQATLKFSDEKIGVLQTNWITPTKKRKISINFTRGFLEADYITQEITIYSKVPEKMHKDYFHLLKQLPEENVIKLRNVEPLKIELLHFIDCVQNNIEPETNGETGYNALKTAIKITQSIRSGRVINLEEND